MEDRSFARPCPQAREIFPTNPALPEGRGVLNRLVEIFRFPIGLYPARSD